MRIGNLTKRSNWSHIIQEFKNNALAFLEIWNKYREMWVLESIEVVGKHLFKSFTRHEELRFPNDNHKRLDAVKKYIKKTMK